MIRNCIFDIGKVLIYWTPQEMVKSFCPDEVSAELVLENTYLHPIWQKLDAGEMSIPEAIKETSNALSGEYGELVRTAYEDFTDRCEVIEESFKLVKKLKEEGYKLYLASNFNERVYSLAERLKLFSLFDGYIFSFEEKIVKPKEEFFERLLKRYSLKAEECVFIDDLPSNVLGAKKAGIRGVVFENNQEAIYNFIKSI